MPSVARIVGMTIASMMASELNRISRSAAAIGPFGSRTPSEQPPSAAAPIKRAVNRPRRMSALPCRANADMSPREGQAGLRPASAVAGQQSREQQEEIGGGEHEQAGGPPPLAPRASVGAAPEGNERAPPESRAPPIERQGQTPPARRAR